MLQNIRDNSQGWIAKTIIGFIVLLLAFSGFEAIFNSGGNSQNAAEVNGEAITLRAVDDAVNQQRRELVQRFGRDFDASQLDDAMMREVALNGLIDRTLLLQAAKNAGFAISDQVLDQEILSTPLFQEDGQFSAANFDRMAQALGVSRMQLRQLLTQDLLIGQLRAGVAASAFVTQPEVDRFAELELQTRSFGQHVIAADTAKTDVSDEQVQAYYAEHQAEFQTPEQVVLEYVQLSKDQFFDQARVNDEQLKEEYQNRIANLEEQRRAAHILIEVSDSVSDADAKAKIDALAERISAGEDFAALAKAESQDVGSAADGGDLGFSGEGENLPEFEEALNGLQVGQVSAPVRTEYGWHLIKLLDLKTPNAPAFDALKPEIERELKAQQVEQLFVDASKQLESSAFESSDLSQPAADLGLTVATMPAFGREGGEGLAANRQVIQAAFSEELLSAGANSGLIELDPDTVVVVRVKEHLQPKAIPLDDIKAQIAQQLQLDQASKQAKAQGEQLIAELREGKADSLNWTETENAARNADIDMTVLQSVFRLPHPESAEKPTYGGVSLPNGDFVVLRLSNVGQLQETLDGQEREMISRSLASREGQQDLEALGTELRNQAKIERF